MLTSSVTLLREKAFERRVGLRDHQNLYFSAFLVSPLLNSWHFLTLISEFAAMITVPNGIASDADWLQLANKALWLSVLRGASQSIPLDVEIEISICF